LAMVSGAADRNAYNVVNMLLGPLGPQVEALIYLLVGLSGLYQVYFGYQLYEEN
jgi:uncharacterized membrane protein YuzA (DUF378 family)